MAGYFLGVVLPRDRPFTDNFLDETEEWIKSDNLIPSGSCGTWVFMVPSVSSNLQQ
jgi:hypothetical protein